MLTDAEITERGVNLSLAFIDDANGQDRRDIQALCQQAKEANALRDELFELKGKDVNRQTAIEVANAKVDEMRQENERLKAEREGFLADLGRLSERSAVLADIALPQAKAERDALALELSAAREALEWMKKTFWPGHLRIGNDRTFPCHKGCTACEWERRTAFLQTPRSTWEARAVKMGEVVALGLKIRGDMKLLHQVKPDRSSCEDQCLACDFRQALNRLAEASNGGV